MKRIGLVFAALAALVSAPALAQDYAEPGVYGQINGVASFLSDSEETAVGASGRLGYRMSPNLAIEGQVDYSGDFAGSGARLSATLVTLNGKYFFLQEQLQPFVLAGVGGQFAKAGISGLGSGKEEAFVVKAGGGLDFYFTERAGLSLEAVYNIGTGDLSDFDWLGLGWGVFYRF